MKVIITGFTRYCLLLYILMLSMIKIIQAFKVRNFQRPISHQNYRTRITKSKCSSSDKPFFITTPIYYVNGDPHLGHAYTSVSADVISRFNKKLGKEVYFLTGTDEHGQKVQNSASLAGKSPKEFADEVSLKFKSLADLLMCDYDRFIRTTDEDHRATVQSLWKKLVENDQIYLGAYEGWYSIRDEAFYGEDELIDGKAPTGAPVEWVKEESYFFKLSNYTQKLLDFYKENPDFVGPESRINEVISFVGQEGGLRDLSISRTTFDWGIPVQSDPKHVMYVWLDALANYITALGYPNSDSSSLWKFWPADIHIVGKDILRFHTVYWPAFLMAAGINPPRKVFAHGWWTVNGEKMSKSLGNVINPFELVEKYGVDYVRYFLCSEVTFGGDGDFSDDALIRRINGNLANDLGNLAQRVFTMTAKYTEGKVPTPGGDFTKDDEEILRASEEALQHAQTLLSTQSLHRYCLAAIDVATLGNKYIDTEAPWKLAKSDLARLNTVLYVLTEVVRRVAVLLEPVMPMSCEKLLDQCGAPPEMRTFHSIQNKLAPGSLMAKPTPVFPKIVTETPINSKETTKKSSKKASK